MSAAYFTIEQLARLEAKSVAAALTWLESIRTGGPDRERFGRSLPRRALFCSMIERSLPIPLELLGCRSLLLIDDEPAVLRSMSRVLRQAAPDLKLLIAEGPHDGLSRVAAELPDVVLLDAYMPEIGGVEVCALVHAARATKHSTVLAMSADPTPELAAAFARAGAIAFLEKPVDAPSLFEVLSAHLVPNSAGE